MESAPLVDTIHCFVEGPCCMCAFSAAVHNPQLIAGPDLSRTPRPPPRPPPPPCCTLRYRRCPEADHIKRDVTVQESELLKLEQQR